MLDGATHFAFRFVALDGTLAASKLLAASGATWLFTDWFTYLIADRRRTFPLTLWVAVFTFAAVT